jgi:peptidoglycan/LPS O-acetylase OafA/YrhL
MSDSSPNLDVLRSLAVIFVVISHLLLDNSLLLIGRYHAQTLGTLGVMIFFVHTCLVLMRSLERQDKLYRHRSLASSFLIRRAFRIYPMSIVLVVVLASIERLHSHAHPALSTFLSNLFLVQNLTDNISITPVLWSLPFECQMYLFLPGLYLLTGASARYGWRFIMTLWLLSIAVVFVVWLLGLDVYLIKFFPCFLPGVLAYCLRDLSRVYPPAVLFAYIALAAIAYPLLVGLGYSATVVSWFLCLMLGALIPRCREIGAAWLKTAGSVVARYSYGIYLVHVPVIYLAFHYFSGLPPILAWAGFVAGVAGLSFAAYHLVEKPGIEIGRILADRLIVHRRQSAPQA